MLLFLTLLTALVAQVSLQNSISISSRVMGGGDFAKCGKYPYHVALLMGRQYICGGSIISTTYVLTAGHCTYGRYPSQIRVRVGSIDLRTHDGQTVIAQEFILHPQYNNTTHDFDLALIRLRESLKCSSTVNKIKLSTAPLYLHEDTVGVVIGFGCFNGENTLSPRLKSAQVLVWTRDQCNSQNVPGVTDHMVCTGNPAGGINSCQGDSGGPLVVNNKLYGVVSWGFGCDEKDKPAVYAYVGAGLDWIKKVAGV